MTAADYEAQVTRLSEGLEEARRELRAVKSHILKQQTIALSPTICIWCAQHHPSWQSAEDMRAHHLACDANPLVKHVKQMIIEAQTAAGDHGF